MGNVRGLGNASGCDNQALLFATSRDGLAWHKPELGLVDFGSHVFSWLPAPLRALGSRNNVVLMGGGVGVARDPRLPPGAAGSVVGLGSACFSPGGVANCTPGGAGVSADGLQWGGEVTLHWPQPLRWDCHNNAFWDAATGQWVATLRNFLSTPPHAPLGRCVAQATAPAWCGPWTPAPPTVLAGAPELQMYSMVTFRWADVLLGVAMVFDTVADIMHCRLAWAPAPGDNFTLFAGAGDVVPLGASGAFDSHVCFAAVHPVAPRGAPAQVYYMGGNGPHFGVRDSALGLATLREDGWAGLAASGGGGVSGKGRALLPALNVTAALMVVTLDVWGAGGSVRVGARGAPGLGVADCVPVTANGTRVVVGFVGGADFGALVGQQVDVDVELVNATLFVVGFEPASRGLWSTL